jgi:aromatic ring-opening dioxygenase catalytic subunit (LigB family)
MAEIVAGIGVPHAPLSPSVVAKEGLGSSVGRNYAAVARHIEDSAPDVLVVFSNDHFNTFFLDNFPTFAVGAAEATSGPNDQTTMPSYELPVHAALGRHLRAKGIEQGFDLAISEEFSLDHSFMVPLHFLNAGMKIPIVPVFVNAFLPPLPSAARCHALGRAVRAAIESWPENLRVVAIGSGSFSLEIGGPKIPAGRRNGIPNPQWVERVYDHLADVRIGQLIEECTPAQFGKSGNASGEVLNWIAMLGVIGDRKPIYLEPQPDHGDSFAVWRWD